jgi:hypothetical protein
MSNVRTNTSTARILAVIAESEAAIAAEQERIAQAKAILLDRIAVGESVETEVGRVTVYTQTTTKIDLDTLAEIDPDFFGKVTKPALDTAKFTAFEKVDAVPTAVQEITTKVVSDPRLRITFH